MCIYIHIHIMSVSLNAPGTQKTFVLLGKGLVLKGSPSNTDIILAPLLHWYWRAIYTYTHMYTCNYTVCASFPHFSTNHGNQDANSHLPLTSFLQRLGANVEAHAAPAMRRQLDIEWPSWVSNPQKRGYCWWFRNPANQLRLVGLSFYPIIYKVFYIPGGLAECLPSTIWKRHTFCFILCSCFIWSLSRVVVPQVHLVPHLVPHLLDSHGSTCHVVNGRFSFGYAKAPWNETTARPLPKKSWPWHPWRSVVLGQHRMEDSLQGVNGDTT